MGCRCHSEYRLDRIVRVRGPGLMCLVVEDSVVPCWLEDADRDDFVRLATERSARGLKATDECPPRVLMACQPEHLVVACEAEFFRRGWLLLRVDDITSARTVISSGAPAAVVLPLDDQKILDGGFCAAIRDHQRGRYMPVVAFAPGTGPARAQAFEAGFDAFVAHSAGAAGLCRELAVLLSIAEELGPSLLRMRSPWP